MLDFSVLERLCLGRAAEHGNGELAVLKERAMDPDAAGRRRTPQQRQAARAQREGAAGSPLIVRYSPVAAPAAWSKHVPSICAVLPLPLSSTVLLAITVLGATQWIPGAVPDWA